VIQNKKIASYRNSYINLAISLFAYSEPVQVTSVTANISTGEWNWSLWDRIDIKEGDITLDQLFEYLRNKFGLEVTMLSYKESMLFNGIGLMGKKLQDRLQTKVTDLARQIRKEEFLATERYMVLEAMVSYNDQDVEIPSIRHYFRPKDGDLSLNRVKPEETLVEARSDTDVQIVRLI